MASVRHPGLVRTAAKVAAAAFLVFLLVHILLWSLPPLLRGEVPPLPPAPPRPPRLPTLAASAAILGFYWQQLAYGAFALYSRLRREAVPDQATRDRMLALIRAEPGIHAREVAARLELSWGVAVHHLATLERHRFVASWMQGRYRRFALSGAVREEDREAVGTLRHPTARAMRDLIAQRPGLTQKEVREALQLSSPLATLHARRMVRAGLLTEERRGRTVRYRLGAAARAGPA